MIELLFDGMRLLQKKGKKKLKYILLFRPKGYELECKHDDYNSVFFFKTLAEVSDHIETFKLEQI